MATKSPEMPARIAWKLRGLVLVSLLLAAPRVQAQTAAELHGILDRLERLEAQNRELAAEVARLRDELAASRADPPQPAPSPEERLEVQETRTRELAQSKVEASERFPIRLNGMVLFNSFLNSGNAGSASFPVVASAGRASGGASFRQTIVGFDYNGPTTFWNGKISGSLQMDLWGGSGRLLDQDLRVRTARIGIDWSSRSFTVALDKPLIAMRDPESLAQVAVSPLTGAGNLWLWIPQARLEQRVSLGETTGIRAQAAVVQTREGTALYSNGYDLPATPLPPALSSLEAVRPGVETRVEFFSGADRRIEIASGFHHSVTHAAGASLPSTIYTADWLLRPARQFEFSGTLFTGTNTGTLGGLQQGTVILAARNGYAVHSEGGWGQFTWKPHTRLWFNLFSGIEDPRDSQLPKGTIGRNLAIGGNVFLALAPNVLGSFEIYQYRTAYIGAATLLTNHYDLALAYRF